MKKTNQLEATHIFLKMLLLITVLSVSKMNAQTDNSSPFLSVQISSNVTGSGLGGNVCPSLAITKNQSTFSIGPNFQRKRLNFSGVQANYRYSAAVNYTGKRELFFFGNVTFHNSARMSDSYIDIEKSCNSESTYNYDALRLKVIESYVGLGVKVNPTKRFNACLSVGMGVFDTMNKNYNREMYREKTSVALRFNCSLIYNLNLNNTKRI